MHPVVRWLPPEKLHLTLVFLGPTDPLHVSSIAAALASVAARHAPIAVETGKGGGRIDGRRGGVAWLRLDRGERNMVRLSRDVDRALGSHAYSAGRGPRPHLTVARGATNELLQGLSLEAVHMRWVVERIALFRSHTGPKGSRYEELAAYTLMPAIPVTPT